MTSKIIEWLIGKPKPHNTPSYVSAFKAEAEATEPNPKEPEKRDSFAKSREDREDSRKALAEWSERANAALAKYKPKGGEFRIRQMPAGHYVIERRQVLKARSPSLNSYEYGAPIMMGPPMERWADEIEKQSVAPREIYETVKNTDTPIMVKRHGYSHYSSYSRYPLDDGYRLEGYQDLAFNAFEDAEAYLKRMASPADGITEYDFPPLKKRVAKKPVAKKEPAK